MAKTLIERRFDACRHDWETVCMDGTTVTMYCELCQIELDRDLATMKGVYRDASTEGYERELSPYEYLADWRDLIIADPDLTARQRHIALATIPFAWPHDSRDWPCVNYYADHEYWAWGTLDAGAYLTQKSLAEMTGLSPAVVSKELTALEEKGWFSTTGRRGIRAYTVDTTFTTFVDFDKVRRA